MTMNNQPKFRFWDGERMRQDVNVTFGNDGFLYEWLCAHPTHAMGALYQPVKRENWIAMQFTGLHDSTKWEDLTEHEREQWTRQGNMPSRWKGKEIYEGDIFLWFDLSLPIEVGALHGRRFMFGSDILNKGYARGGKVNGNIYEDAK